MPDEPNASEQPNPTTVVLLGKCKDGDGDALDELARRFYPPVYRMIRARMGPVLSRKEGVEDLVQDAFVRLLEGLHSFEARPDSHFIAYMAKVAHGTVVNKLDYYNAQKRDVAREVPVEGMRQAVGESTFGIELVQQTTSPGSKVANQEMEDIVDSCLANLEPSNRDVILLRDYAGADWTFIARELDRPSVGAAQMLHQRARARLSEAVRPYQ